jgi:hypothetical protein
MKAQRSQPRLSCPFSAPLSERGLWLRAATLSIVALQCDELLVPGNRGAIIKSDRVAGNGHPNGRPNSPAGCLQYTRPYISLSRCGRVYSISVFHEKLTNAALGHADRIGPIAYFPITTDGRIIRRRIGTGQYQPATRTPIESEIVEEFEVARTRTRRVVAVWCKEGLVHRCATEGAT